MIVIDYCQNLTLPSVASTPSQWYFVSLWAVNVFGIYYANRALQYNFVYGEDVAGKGSEEVISMLSYFLRKVAGLQAPKRLTIYADNCTGQNKNNFVAKYLLALVQTATLVRVELKFLVKGHTKNAVDRGFGHQRKKFARTDVWTMDQLVRLVDDAATSFATVPINANSDVFKSFKVMLTEAYRDIPGIRKYQVFLMLKEHPGMVHCHVGTDDEPVEFDLRRVYDGIKVDGQRVELLFEEALTAMPRRSRTRRRLCKFTRRCARMCLTSTATTSSTHRRPRAKWTRRGRSSRSGPPGVRARTPPSPRQQKSIRQQPTNLEEPRLMRSRRRQDPQLRRRRGSSCDKLCSKSK